MQKLMGNHPVSSQFRQKWWDDSQSLEPINVHRNYINSKFICLSALEDASGGAGLNIYHSDINKSFTFIWKKGLIHKLFPASNV